MGGPPPSPTRLSWRPFWNAVRISAFTLNPLAALPVKYDSSQGQSHVWPASVFNGQCFHDLRLHGAGHALAGV